MAARPPRFLQWEAHCTRQQYMPLSTLRRRPIDHHLPFTRSDETHRPEARLSFADDRGTRPCRGVLDSANTLRRQSEDSNAVVRFECARQRGALQKSSALQELSNLPGAALGLGSIDQGRNHRIMDLEFLLTTPPKLHGPDGATPTDGDSMTRVCCFLTHTFDRKCARLKPGPA